MPKTYLNDALKAKAAEQARPADNGEVKLDDVSRVKVLSPGRQVFKRFIRNRLAVFGSILLITMFVFSFIGPLFYAYGQKQIFYKYDNQVVNYAMAKENTAYNGFTIDAEVAVENAVNNVMNSRIKAMIAAGQDQLIVFGEDGAYRIDRLAEDIYQLSRVQEERIGTFGDTTADMGVYSMISKKIEGPGVLMDGLEAAVQAAVAENPAGGEFLMDGITFTYTRGKAKSYTVTASLSGIQYDGEHLGEGFEMALLTTDEQDFEYDGATYSLKKSGSAWEIYRIGEAVPARVFSRLTVDTFETGAQVSTELRVGAMLAAAGDGAFTADGRKWTVSREGGFWLVRDEVGAEYMELTPFSVRRYNGDDTVEYGRKKALAKQVE